MRKQITVPLMGITLSVFSNGLSLQRHRFKSLRNGRSFRGSGRRSFSGTLEPSRNGRTEKLRHVFHDRPDTYAGLGSEWDGADLTAFGGPATYGHYTNLFAGKEFDINEHLTARAGYYFDPAPDKTLNILFPSSTNHAYTFGGSYRVNNFNVDLCIEYLIGNDRNVMQSAENTPGFHQMDIFAYSLALKYDF